MAMTSQAVIERACGGDPTRLRRLAVRFASNVFPGNDVEVQVYDAGTVDGGRHGYAFEATSILILAALVGSIVLARRDA